MEHSHTMTRLSVAASLALLTWACGGSPIAPTRYPATSPVVQPPPVEAIYTLSGTIFEMTQNGQAPIEGVKVEQWSCALNTGCRTYVLKDALTNKDGFYTMSGLYAGNNNYFWATKAGYDDPMPESTPCDGGCHILSVDGDTRFDMQLARH